MTTPTTTQQLYKLISANHRLTLQAMDDLRHQESNEHSETLYTVADILIADQKTRKRMLYAGFSVCAALIVGIGVADYREMKNLDDLTRTAIDYQNVIISVEKDQQAYIVGFWDDNPCPQYEVWPLNNYDEYGRPVRKGKPVATFTLPGMPDCKP